MPYLVVGVPRSVDESKFLASHVLRGGVEDARIVILASCLDALP